MIETRECGCRSVWAGENVVSVSTCPQCLPVGAITWLIENGRQLELFGEQGVVTDVRGLESIENAVQNPVKPSEGVLNVLPF